jgi:hypothetical protein
LEKKLRELSMKLCLEEQKSHLAILTLGEKVSWVVPIFITTDRAVTRDCHEMVNTRVEREAIADGEHIEVSNLMVHELCKGIVLDPLTSDWCERAELFQKEV